MISFDQGPHSRKNEGHTQEQMVIEEELEWHCVNLGRIVSLTTESVNSYQLQTLIVTLYSFQHET